MQPYCGEPPLRYGVPKREPAGSPLASSISEPALYRSAMSEISLYEAMRTTRAVRRLRPDPIAEDVLRRVLQAATFAPSGGNRQAFRILVVRDATLKQAIAQQHAPRWHAYAARGRAASAQLSEGARSRTQRTLAAGDYLADHMHEVPAILVVCFDPRGLLITDTALGRPSVVGGASIYPAVQNVLLACRAEGLGCVLTTLLCEAEPVLRPLLELPEPWATAAFVPIGYPVGSGHGPLQRRPVEEMVFADRFGKALFTP
jgi:nitroreductase